MARKPVSDNVKQLRGTDQPCRARGETVEFEEITVAPDAPVSLNVHGQEYWDRIVPVLLGKRILSVADLESLEMMCLLYGKVRQAAQAGVDLSASTVTQLRLYQVEFGLTPASRARIKAGDDGRKGNKFTGNGKAKA